MKNFLILALAFFFAACGLMKPALPKQGEFCDPMFPDKSCVFLDGRNLKAKFESTEYELKMNGLGHFEFVTLDGRKIKLDLVNEHRLEFMDSSQPGKMSVYLRKKNKRK